MVSTMDLEQKYALKQLEITRSTLNNLRAEESTCDVILVCGDLEEVLPAHRLILRAGSKYFEAMFSSDVKEASSNRVAFPTINRPLMKYIVDFIYLQKVNVDGLDCNGLSELLSAARLLAVSPLVEICVDKLCSVVNGRNWASILEIANWYSIKVLMSAVIQHLTHYKCGDYEALALAALDDESFHYLISTSTREKSLPEDTLVDLALRWASCDKTNRKTHLKRLLSHVDFSAVSRSIVTNVISENDLFTENPELAHFLLQKLYPTTAQPADLHTATSKPKLLIFKSNVLHLYDIIGKEWSVHNLMDNLVPEPYSSVAVSNQTIYFITKFNRALQYDSYYGHKTDTGMHIVAFYPHLGCGNVVAKFPQKSKFGMVFLNNVLYIMGGVSTDKCGKSSYFDCFDLITKVWRCLAAPNFRRQYPKIVTLQNNLYVFGGQLSNGSSVIRDVDMYNVTANQWTTVTTMPECGSFTVAVCMSTIYLATRVSNQQFHSKLFKYNLTAKSWKSVEIVNMRLCGSCKPLPYLIFEHTDKYCRVNPQTKKRVTIMQKKGSAVEAENVENGNVIIFA